MKKLFTLILLLAPLMAVLAQTTKTSTGTGNWTSPPTWSPSGVPTSGNSPSSKNVIIIAPGNIVALNNNVTLNNVDIRIYGTLRINIFRTLNLGTNCVINVYAGGSITGQLLSGTITIGGVSKFTGATSFNSNWAVGEVQGPAFASGATGTGTLGFSFGALPVSLKDFNAYKTATGQVRMTWITSHETNSKEFQIQKSINGRDWSIVGTVPAAGSSRADNYYYFVDQAILSSNTYYRLKQIDLDGRSTFSAVRNLKFSGSRYSFITYPNPARDAITVSFGAELKADLTLRLLTPTGQELYSTRVAKGSNLHVLDIAKLKTGNYFVQMIDEYGSAESLQFNKQ